MTFSSSTDFALPQPPLPLLPLPQNYKMPRYSLKGYPGEVRWLAFSPEAGSPTFVMDGWATLPQLRDTTTGKCLLSFGDSPHYAASAGCFSPDGKLVITANHRGTIYLWDAATAQLLGELTGLDSTIIGLACFENSTRLLASTYHGQAGLWELPSGKLINRLEVKGSFATLVNQTGQLLTYGREQPITLWQVESGQLLASLEPGNSNFWIKAFSPDGSKLVICTHQLCLVAGVAEAKPLMTLDHHQQLVVAAAFSPDGQYLLTGATDRLVRLWELASQQLVASYPLFESYHLPQALALSADNRLVLTGAQQVALWEVQRQSPVLEYFEGHHSYLSAIAFSPDGTKLATASQDGTLRLWLSATGQLQQTLAEYKDGLTCLAFSPDGSLVATAATDATVHLYQLDQSQPPRVFRAHSAWIRCLAFSPNGKYLASGGEDEQLFIWELAAAQADAGAGVGKAVAPLKSFSHSSGWVVSALFLAQSRRLVTGTSQGQLKLWELAGESESGEILAGSMLTSSLKGRVRQLVADEIGQRLVSGTDLGELSVWELEVAGGGQLVAALAGPDQPVTLLSFSPDREYLMAGYSDGQLQLWHYPSLQLAKQYKLAHTPQACYWQSPRGVMLADRGGARGQPERYRLELELD